MLGFEDLVVDWFLVVYLIFDGAQTTRGNGPRDYFGSSSFGCSYLKNVVRKVNYFTFAIYFRLECSLFLFGDTLADPIFDEFIYSFLLRFYSSCCEGVRWCYGFAVCMSGECSFYFELLCYWLCQFQVWMNKIFLSRACF